VPPESVDPRLENAAHVLKYPLRCEGVIEQVGADDVDACIREFQFVEVVA
jgi:hypothetical protein